MSTNRAFKVCASLAEESVYLPTPTQLGVWHGFVRLAEKMKDKIKLLLKEEKDFCLHFDGKRPVKHEYPVLCLKIANGEIRLGVARCKSGSSQDIYDELEKNIDECDAWPMIKMIICGTTAVNTGRLNDVVNRIQKAMVGKGLEMPQYILDRILKYVLDIYLSKTTTKQCELQVCRRTVGKLQ